MGQTRPLYVNFRHKAFKIDNITQNQLIEHICAGSSHGGREVCTSAGDHLKATLAQTTVDIMSIIEALKRAKDQVKNRSN